MRMVTCFLLCLMMTFTILSLEICRTKFISFNRKWNIFIYLHVSIPYAEEKLENYLFEDRSFFFLVQRRWVLHLHRSLAVCS